MDAVHFAILFVYFGKPESRSTAEEIPHVWDYRRTVQLGARKAGERMEVDIVDSNAEYIGKDMQRCTKASRFEIGPFLWSKIRVPLLIFTLQ